MTVFPAIDIMRGRCVRLSQGKADAETVYYENPLEPAEAWLESGARWLHAVDLEGAFEGRPVHLHVLRALVGLGFHVQWGGGLRCLADVESALNVGAKRIIIGTQACENDAFLYELVQAFGPRVAVGIDAKAGKVAVRGWVDTSSLDALHLAKRVCDLGVETLIYTDIARDGMLDGPNIMAQKIMLDAVPAHVIASGGVGSLEDVKALAALKQTHPNFEGAIVGKALYEGRVALDEALPIMA